MKVSAPLEVKAQSFYKKKKTNDFSPPGIEKRQNWEKLRDQGLLSRHQDAVMWGSGTRPGGPGSA